MAAPRQSMTKAERMRATLAGQETDRSPISLWHHFPGRDDTVPGLVAATLEFQRRLDLDLIKLMPTGMYPMIDYGATVGPRPDEIGTTRIERSPVQQVTDWERLPAAPPDRGVLADQVEVVRRLRAELGPDVPMIQTIFSPLTMVHKLAGAKFLEYVRQDEASLTGPLERFVTDVVAFGRACLEAGADGFFFATQHANPDAQLPAGAFERLGAAYDQRLIEALRSDERNWCTVLHLHGLDPFFELAERYPVDAVNWHDRETEPSLRQALGRTSRALVAGLNRSAALEAGPAAMAEQVRDAVEQVGGRRLVVAPGCVFPATTPAETLQAMRQAVSGTA